MTLLQWLIKISYFVYKTAMTAYYLIGFFHVLQTPQNKLSHNIINVLILNKV